MFEKQFPLQKIPLNLIIYETCLWCNEKKRKSQFFSGFIEWLCPAGKNYQLAIIKWRYAM